MVGINVTKARIPVEFEFNDDSDSRFKKVKVWIAHTGENLNNSYFSKETLEIMAETLPKIPILGYLEVDEDGNDDFSDHRREIVIKSGEGVDIRYAGHAYGFIPEDANPNFEIRDGKEWLTAEGYVWTKFKDAINVFGSSGVKSQSMEIIDAEGEVDDIGRMVFTSARFDGLCILGDTVSPAMIGSTVEFFSDKKSQYQSELDNMYMEFQREKGELDLEDNLDNLDDIIEEPEVVEEPVVFEDDEPEAVEGEPDTDNDLEPEVVEPEAVEPEAVEPEVNEGVEPEDPKVDDEPEAVEEKSMFSIDGDTVSINFQLSHDDQRHELYKKLDEKITNGYHYILDMFNDHAIVNQVSYDDEWEAREDKMLRVSFKSDNDVIELGEVEEVFSMYLSESEKVTIDKQRAEISELNTRLDELSEYKHNSELEAKGNLLNQFAEELEEETVKSIQENFSTMSVEDVEKEVALQLFKMAQANKTEPDASISVHNFSKATEQRYGSLDKYFK